MTHVARPDEHRRARSRRCRRPASSWWTFWAPTATSGSALGERVADRGEADERRADDPDDARARGSGRRSSAASSPASAGVVCIFQLAATITSRIGANHARAGSPIGPDARRDAGRPTPRRRGVARSARAPAGPPTGGARAARRARASVASGVSRRAVGDQPDDVRLRRPAARPPRASSIASSWRPAALTARWRFADSALRTRLSSPRRARETWRASSSSSAPAAPIRRRNVPTASPLFQVTTPRPRRTRHDAGSPISARRAARIGASSGSTTNSRCVRPPARLSEPRARNRPRSQAVRQWSAARRPVEGTVGRGGTSHRPRRRPGGPPRRRPAGRRALARRSRVARPEARRPRPPGRRRGTGRSRRARRAAPRRGRARTGSSRPLRRSRPTRAVGRRAGSPPRARGRAMIAVGEPGRVVVMGIVGVDDVVEDEARDRRRPPAASASRTGSAAPVLPGGRARRSGCWRATTSTRPGAVCATSASTCAARSKPVVSPSCVATLQTKTRGRRATQRRRRGCRGRAGSAGGSCRGCPGRGR